MYVDFLEILNRLLVKDRLTLQISFYSNIFFISLKLMFNIYDSTL